MPGAIAAGERNPRDAGPARPRHHARQDRPAGRSPGCSFVTEEHAAVLAMMLAAIDYHSAQIGELTAKIAVLCQPYEHQIAQPARCPAPG